MRNSILLISYFGVWFSIRMSKTSSSIIWLGCAAIGFIKSEEDPVFFGIIHQKSFSLAFRAWILGDLGYLWR